MDRGAGDRKATSGPRFLLWMDMEGVSQITDYRESLPVHSEYWRTGRAKFTADATAAASGLLKGGAKEVVVIDGHGLGWPNLLEEKLPKGVRPFQSGDVPKDFDELLMAGFHARCGTPDGFMSHTYVPYFRMAINGSLATECHGWAMRAGIPVLGIIGDAALGTQLNGILDGTPFLAVKRSSTRTATTPLYSSTYASSSAIEEFSTKCARDVALRMVPVISAPFVVSFSMPPELAKLVDGMFC